MNKKQKEEFVDEMLTAIKVSHHPNVVRVWGFTREPKVAVVMEHCKYGSLDHALSRHDLNLTFVETLDILCDVAKGMCYLHELDILHRDIAARNILLDAGRTGKVCDFGMSRNIKGDRHKTEARVGPLKWMSPESMQRSESTKKSDVYAFGITMWEVLMNQEPYPNMQPFPAAMRVIRDKKFRPNTSEIPCRRTRALMAKLWNASPKKRPTFEEALKELRSISAWHKQPEDSRAAAPPLSPASPPDSPPILAD